MTEKQKRFCDEYLIDCNATRAYKAVYKGVKTDDTARVCASKLLTNTNVKSYISEQLEKLHNNKIADAREVIEYLTSVMRGESEAEVLVVEGRGEGYSEARKFKKAPDEKERLKAAEMLGKYYTLFTERTQIEGVAQIQIIDDIPDIGVNNE